MQVNKLQAPTKQIEQTKHTIYLLVNKVRALEHEPKQTKTYTKI